MGSPGRRKSQLGTPQSYTRETMRQGISFAPENHGPPTEPRCTSPAAAQAPNPPKSPRAKGPPYTSLGRSPRYRTPTKPRAEGPTYIRLAAPDHPEGLILKTSSTASSPLSKRPTRQRPSPETCQAPKPLQNAPTILKTNHIKIPAKLHLSYAQFDKIKVVQSEKKAPVQVPGLFVSAYSRNSFAVKWLSINITKSYIYG